MGKGTKYFTGARRREDLMQRESQPAGEICRAGAPAGPLDRLQRYGRPGGGRSATSTAATVSTWKRRISIPPRALGDAATRYWSGYIRQYIEAQGPTRSFRLAGREPTLLGVDFFRNVVELEKKYADGKRIENTFQTNGMLLDDAWGRVPGREQVPGRALD